MPNMTISDGRNAYVAPEIKTDVRLIPGHGHLPKLTLKPNSAIDLQRFMQLLEQPPDNSRNDSKENYFNLPEAPTYYPTELEFKDPPAYIENIRKHAQRFGICKIVPPSGWRPKFAIDPTEFQFQSRLQKLNKVGANTRLSQHYMDCVYLYHKQASTNLRFLPPQARKSIDLFLLKDEVELLGGYRRVLRDNKWNALAETLNYKLSKEEDFASNIKMAYEQLILPYEEFLSMKTISLPKNHEEIETKDKKICQLCVTEKSSATSVACSRCTRVYHITCLKPTTTKVPKGTWYGPCCINTIEDQFGFSAGKTYNLVSFKKRADIFKNKYFGARLTGDRDRDEYRVEREFWRIVSSPFERVEVEYGADLFCPLNRSGFPTKIFQPDDTYSKDKWNLSVLPTLPESLLSTLPDAVSGMTLPWLYAGMCFSTFCWHNEDHYTYSLNYQHFGDTKVWYGIPGDGADIFEKAVSEEAPSLMKASPDLLSHLSTLISPDKLVKRGVPVYRVDQRPNQFVVTFPKAYHAGFNVGFNFNEAVNFAPTDWLAYGQNAVDDYCQKNRSPVFCHEALVIKAAEEATTHSQYQYLQNALTRAHTIELHRRNCATVAGVISRNSIQPLLIDGSPQCSECSAFCSLSSVTCTCPESKGRVSCGEHIQNLCSCPPLNKTLNVHIPESELDQLLSKIANV